MKLRCLPLTVLPLLAASCTTTTVYRHTNGSLTISQRGLKAAPSTYWVNGAGAGRITTAGDLTVFRKFTHKSAPAVPLKCDGFVDATRKKVEIRLVEKQGGTLSQPWVNGRYKVIDENAPKPFYHWLIP
ncbi:hypothetical protein OKA04_01115 [Luteolibacter flavescens]|uniref:Lipoprotein n=1 Tax=Luteolibacter flavescens TaxID=1859460 RepID=A0ABT3FIA7_9BACT|nr:hypothetical protein [Luteolibacter flavescens]MCW1883308.1 hypothetical protein [Luteolibacter flavescens]